MTLGARCLPKFLVQKLGKEKIIHAIKESKPNALDPTNSPDYTRIRNPKRPPDFYSNSSTNNSKAAYHARKKWREIKCGARESDPLYSLDEALERAGL